MFLGSWLSTGFLSALRFRFGTALSVSLINLGLCLVGFALECFVYKVQVRDRRIESVM